MNKYLPFILLIVAIQSVTLNAEEALEAFVELELSQDIDIMPDAPAQYTVVEGDDFAKVMALFVENLDLLTKKWGEDAPKFSPGDTVRLVKSADRYRLQIRRVRKDDRETVKLTPEVRVVEQKRDEFIIPAETIQQFLTRPSIIALEELESAGYIVENPNQTLLVAGGDQIYVRKLEEVDGQNEYIIIRLGQAYQSSEEDDILAYEAIYLGNAKLEEAGDPATLTIINATREIRQGDRLLPLTEQIIYEDFHPHSPDPSIVEDAKIIAVVGNTSRISQYQVVVIDRGTDDGIEVGHTLNVRRSGHTIVDVVDEDAEEIKLPGQHAGDLLVFRAFDAVSYALVMNATFPIKLFDEVVAP